MKTKCIVCEKKIEKTKALKKRDVFFCCKKCLNEYEKKLKALGKVVDWDDCC